MQRRTHASLGAWTLGPTPPAQAWGDAFRSIELVGTSTMLRLEDLASAGGDASAPPEDPIEAARAWLADPTRRAALTEPVAEQAERTLDIAAVHLRELDLLAGELALEANERGGELDPVRLERVDVMASVMRAYAQRLRELLDPETIEVTSAQARLAAGLDAARGGGLSALVAAL